MKAPKVLSSPTTSVGMYHQTFIVWETFASSQVCWPTTGRTRAWFAHVLTYDSLRLAPADRKRAEKLRLSSSGTVELVDFAEITSKMQDGYLAFSLVKGETPQLFIPTQLRYRGPSDYVWQGRTADGDRVCRLKSTPEGISGLYLDYVNDLTARILPGTDSTSILVSSSDNCISGGCALIGAANAHESIVLLPVNSFENKGIPYGMSHEVGHVFGCHHRPEAIANYPNYLEFCAFGYPLQANNATIMFSGKNAIGIRPKRIPYFSDPNQTYFNNPLGTDENNSAGRIRQRGCIIANFQPDLEIHSFINITSPACDELVLEASSQGPAGALTYEWRWSYDGLFTASSPGNFLGSGQQLLITEPVDDPCRSYFVALFTYLNGVEVAFSTKRTRGGACVDNVWCPVAGSKSGLKDKKITSTVIDRQSLYNLSGQLLLTVDRAPWLNHVKRSPRFGTLPAGIYFIRTHYADGTTVTRKIFLGHE